MTERIRTMSYEQHEMFFFFMETVAMLSCFSSAKIRDSVLDSVSAAAAGSSSSSHPSLSGDSKLILHGPHGKNSSNLEQYLAPFPVSQHDMFFFFFNSGFI